MLKLKLFVALKSPRDTYNNAFNVIRDILSCK